MPSFTVTSAGEKISLDATGAAQAQYTVTNTSSDTVSGRLIATPQDPAKAEWFSIAGDSTRDFTPGAAQQVLLQVRVPAGTLAGPYSVRLDAVAEANPDEDFTEGPSVSFDVAAPAPKPPWWKKWWWVILIVAILLLAGIGVGVWLALRGGSSTTTTAATATVPTVTGLHEDEATSQLTGAGFQVGLKKVNTRDAGAVDIVSAQDPAGNAVVPAASKVTISVGQLETVPVPDVVRQTVARANAELVRLGFTVRIATIFTLNRAEIGLVLKQSPGRGAKEPFGSAVTIGVGETKVGAFRPTTTTAG